MRPPDPAWVAWAMDLREGDEVDVVDDFDGDTVVCRAKFARTYVGPWHSEQATEENRAVSLVVHERPGARISQPVLTRRLRAPQQTQPHTEPGARPQ